MYLNGDSNARISVLYNIYISNYLSVENEIHKKVDIYLIYPMFLFTLLVSTTGKKRYILKGIVRYTLNGKNGCILSLSGVER